MQTLRPIVRLAADLRAGKASSVELTRTALARIADTSGEGTRVYTRVYADAVDQVAEQDRRRRQGKVASPLAGLPISIKDLFDVAGETTLAAHLHRVRARTLVSKHQFGLMPSHLVQESMTLFAQTVLPSLRSRGSMRG